MQHEGSESTPRTVHLWCRAGINLDLTPEECEALLVSKDSTPVLRKVLEEGRFRFDGETYIPQGVAEAAFADIGKPVPEDCCDIDFLL